MLFNNDHLSFFNTVISQQLRLDRGSETGEMATMHGYLIDKHGDTEDPANSVRYGPSTNNKVVCFFFFNTINILQHLS